MQSGGPNYGVELGRKDGKTSTKASVEGHLPLARFNYKQLRKMFASHGLSQVDLIALSGLLCSSKPTYNIYNHCLQLLCGKRTNFANLISCRKCCKKNSSTTHLIK